MNYLFRIHVENIRDVEYQVSSVLCDEFQIRHDGKEGFEQIRHASGMCNLSGEFITDIPENGLKEKATDIRRMIYKAAEKYLSVHIQAYPVSGGPVFHGNEFEYARMKAAGELEYDLDDLEEEL